MLQQCISILYDMEINNYTMTRNIQLLNIKIDSLGQKRGFRKPAPKENPVSIYTITIVGLIIGAVAGAVTGIITGLNYGDSVWEGIGQAIINFFFLAVIFGIGGGLLALITSIIIKIIFAVKIKKQCNSDYDDYLDSVRNDELRVEREKQQALYLLRQQNIIRNKLNESKRILEQFYVKLNIDRSYRNLVPMGYMAEYIKLGISNKLEGTDGLYYLVRQELRADQLQNTLEDISGKLDIIIDQNRQLYRELKEINHHCHELVDITVKASAGIQKSLKEIGDCNRITAYNSERSRQELAYQNYLLTCHVL